MDGTTVRVPDSAAHREHFGAEGYASGKGASYRQVRAVTLTAIPTHLVADINFGRYDTNNGVRQKPAAADSARLADGVRQGLSGCRNPVWSDDERVQSSPF